MASNRVPLWGSTFNIHGSARRYHPGYTEWARYILRTEEEVLLKAGVYKAILLSIFCYEMNNNLLRTVIENWSPLSNTLYVEDGEITPTLWDMKNMAGLPILGCPYDEHIPEEEVLFGESEQGVPRSSQVLKALYRRHYRLVIRKQDHISINSWILEFFSASSPETKFPTPRDPFGIGSDNIQVQNLEPMRDPLGVTSEMDRRICSAAFIACWLCYFVVPYRHGNHIRPEVFFVADLITSGVKVSLAPPALANLYRSLREASVTDEPGKPDVVMPIHYLAGWMNTVSRSLWYSC